MIQGSDLVTIALLVALEGLLSADNAMVLAVLVLGLPKKQQRKALRYGIVGAFTFRTIATLLAVYLIRLGWVKLVGAGYLMYLVYNHFGGGQTAEERRAAPPAQPGFGLSAFWATVVKVELTDIVFAIDSILVAVAMSPKTLATGPEKEPLIVPVRFELTTTGWPTRPNRSRTKSPTG